MDKKPLIVVSILAMVLLVMGSLSNVIGYQSVKSTTVNDSPLFSVKTKRATNQQENIITSQYLGMGKENLLQFPLRDNKIESLIKAIEFISKMDDKAFAHFTELVIQGSKQDESLRDTKTNEIVQMLHQIRTQPEASINMLMSRSNGRLDPTTNCFESILYYVPGCTFKLVIFVIIILLAPILVPLIQLSNIFTIIFDC